MDDFRFAQNQPDDRWLRSRQAASGYGPAAVSSNGSHDARQPDNIFDGVPPGYRTTVSSRQSHYPAVQASNPPVPLDGSDEYPPLSGRVTRLQRRSMLQVSIILLRSQGASQDSAAILTSAADSRKYFATEWATYL